MMTDFHFEPAGYILFAGYLISFFALNAVSFLISLFYRKNFQRSSPRWGFCAAMVSIIAACALFLAGRNGSDGFVTIAKLCLIAAAAGSLYSTAGLFFLMRRVRK